MGCTQSGEASDLEQGYSLSNDFLDAIITKINRAPSDHLTDEVLCATGVFQRQPSLVRIQPPTAVIVGDIRGQFWDLQRIFTTHGHPPEQQYVFLGDYVDMGPHSLETIILLFCYKLKYPSNFMLLRGNHECPSTTKMYGFYDEIKRRYQRPRPCRLYDLFNQAFACMPSVGMIGGKILCMHCGLSDQSRSLDQLSTLRRPLEEPRLHSLEINLLWADPAPDIRGVAPSPRGAGVVLFDEDVVESVRNRLGIDYIVRAHQVIRHERSEILRKPPWLLSDGFLDAIITKVNRAPSERFTDEITDEELKQLCKAATGVFQRQPSLVRIQPPTAVIVGDIRGQFWDLQRIFTTHGHPPEQQYVFLGDYVDMGPHSLETIILLFCYKDTKD
ncbi:hypothetical protein niasHT_016105 [Heterodera trifolii]|uniref:Serine/threonine-protein phosphatase n=1 Tax=Heterodera trifolii TaxID=157864 RepID=A0ABD2L8Q7_9BILA